VPAGEPLRVKMASGLASPSVRTTSINLCQVVVAAPHCCAVGEMLGTGGSIGWPCRAADKRRVIGGQIVPDMTRQGFERLHDLPLQ